MDTSTILKLLHFALISALLLCFFPLQSAAASDMKILTNHLGYEKTGPKHAVVRGKANDHISGCSLKYELNDQKLLDVPAKAVGPVKRWRDWYFWTLDFDSLQSEGEYYLECAASTGRVRSYPFHIQQVLLERNTLSEVIYFFKE